MRSKMAEMLADPIAQAFAEACAAAVAGADGGEHALSAVFSNCAIEPASFMDAAMLREWAASGVSAEHVKQHVPDLLARALAEGKTVSNPRGWMKRALSRVVFQQGAGGRGRRGKKREAAAKAAGPESAAQEPAAGPPSMSPFYVPACLLAYNELAFSLGQEMVNEMVRAGDAEGVGAMKAHAHGFMDGWYQRPQSAYFGSSLAYRVGYGLGRRLPHDLVTSMELEKQKGVACAPVVSAAVGEGA